MTENEPEIRVPTPRCIICKQWNDEFASRNNYNEMFRIREGSRMEKWIEKFTYRKIKEHFDERFICENHFHKLDILRISPWDQKPLKVALLTDRKVVPIYFNQISVRKWNTINDYANIRDLYKHCLYLKNWDLESLIPKAIFNCKKNDNTIVIQPTLYVHYYNKGVWIRSKKLDKCFTVDGKIKYWSRLRGLMRYCETKELQP